MVKNPPANTRRDKRPQFDPWAGKIPWRRAWRFFGQRSLSGYSPWGHKELDTTEQLSLFSHDSYIH